MNTDKKEKGKNLTSETTEKITTESTERKNSVNSVFSVVKRN